jgi:hypothetical protein
MPLPPLLMHDWREFIYTDGSVLAADSHTFPGIGAAVYVPAHEEKHNKEKIIAIDCYCESERVLTPSTELNWPPSKWLSKGAWLYAMPRQT